MRVAKDYAVHWVTMRHYRKGNARRLTLLHMPCRKDGNAATVASYRKGKCTHCALKCPQEVIDRACFIAAMHGERLFGWEMRQENLRRWTYRDKQRKLSEVTGTD